MLGLLFFENFFIKICGQIKLLYICNDFKYEL